MSKGMNIFNHFNTRSDGHQVKYDNGYVSCYCPVARDHVSATPTSNGVKCNHCQKNVT